MGRRSIAAALLLAAVALATACEPELVEADPEDPGLSIEPVFDFEQVELGERGTWVVRVPNRGTRPIYLSVIGLEPPFHSNLVEVETIEPGAERVVVFTFEPTSAGRFEEECTLLIGPKERQFRLLGVGLEPEPPCEPDPAADRFEGVRPKVDVLFVVDDHAAMEPYLPKLSAFGSDLADALGDLRIDARFGVTSAGTGDCGGGTLFPRDGSAPAAIDVDTPGAGAILADRLAVPACEGSDGAAIAAALAAIDDESHELLRDDAALQLVFASVRDDHSDASISGLGSLLLARYEAVRLRTASIAGPAAATCAEVEPGRRWADLHKFLGSGVMISICSEDWEGAGLFTEGSTFGMPIAYELRKLPHDANANGDIDGDEVRVSVDGTPVPAVEGTGLANWYFDRTANAVRFHPRAVPPPGSTVRIDYEVNDCR